MIEITEEQVECTISISWTKIAALYRDNDPKNLFTILVRDFNINRLDALDVVSFVVRLNLMLDNNMKVQAIKDLRDRTGFSLKASKEWVDKFDTERNL